MKPLSSYRKDAVRALEAAEKYEEEEPFAYMFSMVPIAVVTSRNARDIIAIIDKLIAAENLVAAIREGGAITAGWEYGDSRVGIDVKNAVANALIDYEKIGVGDDAA